jgi:hypothetical protein
MTLIRVALQNETEVRRALESIPGKARRAFSNAMNRAGRYGRMEAIREISQRVNFPRRYLQQRMELIRARASDLSITIRARKRETLLSRFPNKQLYTTTGAKSGRRKAGIQVSVKRGRVEVLRGGFFVPLKRGKELGGGAVGIAIRERGAKRAFEVLHSTSVHHAFSDVLSEVTVLASDRFNTEIRTALDNELRSL